MSDIRAVTNLGQVEDKLRTFLNLAGEIGIQFQPGQFVPAVIVGDATQPGSTTLRGRRFTAGVFLAAPAGAQCFKIRFNAKSILENVVIGASTWAGLGVRVRMPGTAEIAGDAAVYAATPAGGSFSSWREGVFDADGPPLVVSQGGTVNLGRVAVEHPPLAGLMGGNWPIKDFAFDVGRVINFEIQAAGTNLAIYCEGRIY